MIDKRLWLFTAESFKEMREKVTDEYSLKIIEELERLSMNDEFKDEYDYENVQRKLINSVKEEGYEEGVIAGYENGAKKEKHEIAKNMLQAGETIDKIVLYTRLAKEEIENLK